MRCALAAGDVVQPDRHQSCEKKPSIPAGSDATNFAKAWAANFAGNKQQRPGTSSKSPANKEGASNPSTQASGDVVSQTSATPMLNLLALLSAGLQLPSTATTECEADVEGVDESHAKGSDASRPVTGSPRDADTSPVDATVSTPDQEVFTLKLSKMASDETSSDTATNPEPFHLTAAPSTSAQALSDLASANKASPESDANSEQSALSHMSTLVAETGSGPVIEVPVHKPDTQTAHVSTTEPDANVAVSHANELQKADVRLQLQGDANQRVSVRVLQDTSGFRVTVRSNDILLARSLQEHIPELTTRLQQHQFQAEVSLPAKATTAIAADIAADLRNGQDASPGNGDSSGRRRSTYTRDKKQTNVVSEADNSFSTLLAP